MRPRGGNPEAARNMSMVKADEKNSVTAGDAPAMAEARRQGNRHRHGGDTAGKQIDTAAVRGERWRVEQELRDHGVDTTRAPASIKCPFHGGPDGESNASAEIRKYDGVYRFVCHAAGCETCEDVFGLRAKFQGKTVEQVMSEWRKDPAAASTMVETNGHGSGMPSPSRRDVPLANATEPGPPTQDRHYTILPPSNCKPGFVQIEELGRDVRVFDSVDAWLGFYQNCKGKTVTDYSEGYADPTTGEMRLLKLRVEPGWGEKKDGTPVKKSFVTAHIAADGKVYGFWPSDGLRPMYLNRQARKVVSADGYLKDVVIVEGEKAADALGEVGVAAITSHGGADVGGRKMLKVDWSLLKNACVIFWPDHDPLAAHRAGKDDQGNDVITRGREGHLYMQNLAKYLSQAINVSPWWIDPSTIENLPEKGDAADVVAMFAESDAATAALQQILARKTNMREEPEVNVQASDQSELVDDTHARPLEESDMRAAQIVRERFGADIRYHYERKQWMVYSRGVWSTELQAHVPQCAKTVAAESFARLEEAEVRDPGKIVRNLQSSKGIASVMTLLQSEPGIAVRTAQFDTDNFVLNCRNGTIDLRTGMLRPHNPADYCTKIVPIDYAAGARCDLWDQHLNRIVNGDQEKIRYLKRLFGYFATGDISVEEFYVFFGNGANGKSKTVEMLQYCLGEYAGVAPESLIMARKHGQEHPTELADLKGKRLVVLSETEGNGTLALQRIKRLTGDPTVKARWMRGDFFEFARTHKMLLMSNHKPLVNEDSEAAWRRIRLLPFDQVIPVEERDEHFGEKLKEEASGILRWIVEGAVERLQHGLETPSSVVAATATYREESDDLAEFLRSEIVVGSNCRITRSDLRDAYHNWCARSGEKPLKDKELYTRIRNIDGVKYHQWRHIDNKPERGFQGIGPVHAQVRGPRMVA